MRALVLASSFIGLVEPSLLRPGRREASDFVAAKRAYSARPADQSPNREINEPTRANPRARSERWVATGGFAGMKGTV